MRKRIVVIAAAFVVVSLGLVGLWLVFGNSQESSASNSPANSVLLNFDYQEKFTGFSLEDTDGNEIDRIPNSGKHAVAVYISDTCLSCVDIIKNINRVTGVFGTEDFDYYFLWQDNIPTNLLDKYKVQNVSSYSLQKKTKLATSTPTFFILDESQQVIFKNEDPSLIVEKMVDLEVIQKDKLISNANNYIKDNIIKQTSDKQQMVYFYMEGCSDCAKADAVLDAEVKAKFDITNIYKYDDTNEDRVKDNFKVFVHAYGIQWYPSFLIFEGDSYRLVGETPPDELKGVLLGN